MNGYWMLGTGCWIVELKGERGELKVAVNWG
jgi:hypothetical protein